MTTISKLPPISHIESPASSEKVQPSGKSEGSSFSQVLENAVGQSEGLAFSSHARARLLERQIQLTPGQIDRLNRGVGQAAQKGAKDSLVLLDNLALLVNIRNRVVVTAMDDARTRENVFTQIDSTVIV